MGKFDFEIDPAFLRSLGKLSDVDKYAPQMVNAAVPILEKRVKAELAKHRRTGTMIDSVKKTRAKRTKDGAYIATVRPTGIATQYINSKGELKERKTTVRNMEILAHREYGTKKQAPTPILTKALNDSKSECERAMAEAFKKETGLK